MYNDAKNVCNDNIGNHGKQRNVVHMILTSKSIKCIDNYGIIQFIFFIK